jgi:hypothetical protein
MDTLFTAKPATDGILTLSVPSKFKALPGWAIALAQIKKCNKKRQINLKES